MPLFPNYKVGTLTTVIHIALGLALGGCSNAPTTAPTSQSLNTNNTLMAEQNLQWSKSYMEKIRAQESVHTTASGLAYKIIKQGYGCQAMPNSSVKVHYQAQLAGNLQIVDSSYSRAVPNIFPLDKMIPAWREGIPLMPEGSTWVFYVPPHLAYGVKGSGFAIPPNAAMVFNVQLLQVGTCAPSFIRK